MISRSVRARITEVGFALIIASIFFFLLTPLTHATSHTGGTNTSGGCAPGQLCNPLQSQTVEDFLIAIIQIILVFAVPVIVFFIMYAGYLFVTAQGDASKITEARTALTWALIGGVIILGANAIITVIQGTVEAL
jgi:Type IV secretion system pilin